MDGYRVSRVDVAGMETRAGASLVFNDIATRSDFVAVHTLIGTIEDATG